MRSILNDEQGSAVPVILYILTIFGVGALYTLFFIEIGVPSFLSYVPASSSRTFIMMCIYAIPLFVLVVGSISLIKSGLKRGVY